MKAALGVALLAYLALASGQSVNLTNLEALISGYTGGSDGKPGENYLISMATTLASGFLSGVEGIVTDVVDSAPTTYSELLGTVQSKFCKAAYVNESIFRPPTITGPTFTISFSGGACLLNETTLLDGGDLTVECISPSITLDAEPAVLRSGYFTATKFTDQVCALQKTFGEKDSQVVYILDSGIFNITGVAETLQGVLSPILGEFASVTSGIAASPLLAPALDLLGSAGSELVGLANSVLG